MGVRDREFKHLPANGHLLRDGMKHDRNILLTVRFSVWLDLRVSLFHDLFENLEHPICL